MAEPKETYWLLIEKILSVNEKDIIKQLNELSVKPAKSYELQKKLRSELLKNNLIFNSQYYKTGNVDDMFDTFTFRYELFDDVINYLIFSDRFNFAYVDRTFDTYLQTTLNKKYKNSPIITERPIRFIIITVIVNITNFDLVIRFLKRVVKDNVFDSSTLLTIALEYLDHPESYKLVRHLLKFVKLNENHLLTISQKIKSSDAESIINQFEEQGIKIKSKHEYIYDFLKGSNKISIDLIEKYGIAIDSKYIISCLIGGIYPIPGFDKDSNIVLTDKEMVLINETIFSLKRYDIGKIKIIKEQFGLKFGNECINAVCDNGRDIIIFEYLVNEGLVPDVKSLCKYLQHFCKGKALDIVNLFL